MDPLSTALSCLLCAAQPTDLPPAIARWQPVIAAAAARFDVPQRWIARVMMQESGGQTTLNGKPITSSAGAMGLMQIMPATYGGLRLRYGFGADAYDPHDNIFAGAAYLHELYVRYGYPNLFAAYQTGPARLDNHLLRGRALPDVTTAYVAAITGDENLRLASADRHTSPSAKVEPNALFFVNRQREPEQAPATTSSSLFVTLSATQR